MLSFYEPEHQSQISAYFAKILYELIYFSSNIVGFTEPPVYNRTTYIEFFMNRDISSLLILFLSKTTAIIDIT